MKFSYDKKKQKTPYKKGGRHRCKTGWTIGDSARAVTGVAALAVGVHVVKEVL